MVEALHKATEKGDLEGIKNLLEAIPVQDRKKFINTEDKNELTPLQKSHK